MATKHLITISFFMIVSACGVSKSKHVEYEGDKGDENPEDVALALAAFEENMAEGVSGTCATSGCHGAVPISGDTLVQGDSETNRSVLVAYEKSKGNLYAKISGEVSHSGGDAAASAVTKEQFDAWWAEEAKLISGDEQPQEEEEVTPPEETPPGETAEDAGLTAFKAQLASAVKSNCASCHVATTIEGENLSATDDSQNRNVLKGWVDANPDTHLHDYINTQAHPGNSAGSSFEKAQVDAWLDAEAD